MANCRQNSRYDTNDNDIKISEFEERHFFDTAKRNKKFTFGSEKQFNVVSDTKLQKLQSDLNLVRQNESSSQLNDFFVSAPPVENVNRYKRVPED